MKKSLISFISRIKQPQKFVLISLLFILPLAVVIYYGDFDTKERIGFVRKEKMGVEYTRAVMVFLQDVQQHRGMLNAYLSGDASFGKKLEKKHVWINDHMKAIDAVEKEYGEILKTTEKWNRLKEKWQKMEGRGFSLPPKEGFDEHTVFITDILSLIFHVMNSSNLVLDPYFDSYYMMDTSTNRIPLLTEELGKIRGLGTGAIASGAITSYEKIQLLILSNSVKPSIDMVERGMRIIFRESPELEPLLKTYFNDAIFTTNALLDVLNNRIINAGYIDMKPEEYFATATTAIDASFKLYDALSLSLNRLLQERIDRFTRERYKVGFSLIFIFTLFFYVVIRFNRSLTRQLQAEGHLRQRQEELKNITSTIGEGLLVLDKDRRLAFINPEAERLLGFGRDELLGRDVLVILRCKCHPYEMQPIKDCPILSRAVIKGEPYRTEHIYFARKDGTLFPIEYMSNPIVGETGEITGIVIVFHDITERQRDREGLKNTLSLLSATLESTADGILVVDKDGKTVKTFNQKFLQMWQIPDHLTASWSNEILLSFVIRQLKDPKGFITKTRELYARPDAEGYDILEFKDGRIFERYSKPHRIGGEIFGRVWSYRDITVRKEIEREIRHRLNIEESIAQASRLFASSMEEVGLSQVLKIIGEAISAHRAYIFKFREECKKMDNIHEWCAPGTEPQIDRLQNIDSDLFPWWLERCRKNRDIMIPDVAALPPDASAEKEILRAQNIHSLIAVPINSVTGELTGFIGFDDTKKSRKWSYEDARLLRIIAGMVGVYWDRREMSDQINASLKEKEMLLKEIYHRVKNNLQIISSLFSLQASYIKDKEQAVDILKESRNRIRSMAIVHERLYKSKDLSKINFAEYIQDLTQNLFYSYSSISPAVKMKINVADIYFDVDTAIPLGLIVNELVSNAIKYAFLGGREGEILIDLHPDNAGRFTLIVSDNGVGLPEGLDFLNTESLGLQLVITLTDQLNGKIEMDRKNGTEFRITFKKE